MYNKKKFRNVRFILLSIPRLFRILAKFRKSEKTILLVKIDAIGDYVLFRNFIGVLKNSERYKDYKVEILGNIVWRDLALEYDNHLVSAFHFINEDALYNKPNDVLKLGWKLFNRKYEIVMQSTYSRTLMGNGLAALAAGNQNIAFNSHHEHHPEYKQRTDKFHTWLLELPEDIYHEYDRNHYFFEQVIGQKIPFIPLLLPVNKKESTGILIFAGSSYHKKNWQKDKFLEIIKRLLDNTDESIIIAGGPAEIPISVYLLGYLPSLERIIDMTGKTKLTELTKLISNVRVVITNDTNTVHIAAACQTHAICILGGGHFGRFLPYSSHLPFKPVCVYEEMPCFNCQWNCIYPDLETEPYPCISRINIETVWLEVKKILKLESLLHV